MSDRKTIAGYRVLAKIGEGAASDLYAVQNHKNKQVWALKHVVKQGDKDQRFLDQVENEYRVGSKLDHRNIRHVYRIIRHRKHFIRTQAISLVLELVDAQSLDQLVPLPQLRALKIFCQIARGLAHMHSRGFVHADIKPSNILVNEKDEVKIIDLGQGCPVGTVKQRIQGTPGYMAPEQAHRQAVTIKTDIYNFGATMHWVLLQDLIPTALPPTHEDNGLYSGAIDSEMVRPPDPPHERDPSIHPLLSRMIMQCVQVHPDDRPESMEVVLNRLELIVDLLECPKEHAGDFADGDSVF
jgi:eukaryotic-like serine/threonine-protein kinase